MGGGGGGVIGMQLSLLQVRSQRCMCQILHAAGGGREKVALWRGGAELRRCSARQQSAFMSASLMNERSRFSLTPGRNGAPAPAVLLIVRSPLGEEIKLACGRVNGKKTETRPLGFGVGRNRCGHLRCETMWTKGNSFENT